MEKVGITFIALVIILLLSGYAPSAIAASNSSAVIHASVEVVSSDVVISGFNAQPSATVPGSMILTANISNAGNYSSGNIVVHVAVNGPSPATFTETLPPLAPSQNTIVSITLKNATGSAGSYVSYINASYRYGSSSQSNTQGYSYTVSSSGAVVPGGPVSFASTPPPALSSTYLIAGILVIIAIVIGILYFYNRRRSKKGRTRKSRKG